MTRPIPMSSGRRREAPGRVRTMSQAASLVVHRRRLSLLAVLRRVDDVHAVRCRHRDGNDGGALMATPAQQIRAFTRRHGLLPVPYSMTFYPALFAVLREGWLRWRP